MMSCVTLDVNTIQTGSLEPCHEDSNIQLQQSGTEFGLSHPANAGHVSLHDVSLYHTCVYW